MSYLRADPMTYLLLCIILMVFATTRAMTLKQFHAFFFFFFVFATFLRENLSGIFTDNKFFTSRSVTVRTFVHSRVYFIDDACWVKNTFWGFLSQSRTTNSLSIFATFWMDFYRVAYCGWLWFRLFYRWNKSMVISDAFIDR